MWSTPLTTASRITEGSQGLPPPNSNLCCHLILADSRRRSDTDDFSRAQNKRFSLQLFAPNGSEFLRIIPLGGHHTRT